MDLWNNERGLEAAEQLGKESDLSDFENSWSPALGLVFGSALIGGFTGGLLRVYSPHQLSRWNSLLVLLSVSCAIVRVLLYRNEKIFELMIVDSVLSLCAGIVLIGNIRGNLRSLLFILAYSILPLPCRALIEKRPYAPVLDYSFIHYVFYMLLAVAALFFWLVQAIRECRASLRHRS